MKMNIFISGVSSGIGKALAEKFSSDHNVYGVSRRKTDLNIKHLSIDLTSYKRVISEIDSFIQDIDSFDLVILNAGVLGELQRIQADNLEDLKQTMEVNLWSQKVLLDQLLKKNIENVIAISSGASINGNTGWSGYSLSKAALNMLIKLYADEVKGTKFISLAPGLVDTHMQDIIAKTDSNLFPSLKRIQDARGSELMPSSSDFASIFYKKLPKILENTSGSYIDLRNL